VIRILLRRPIAAAVLLAASVAVHAQTATSEKPAADGAYQPSVGQPGKDVVWVPTPQVLVDTMLDMARVTKNDYVIDLGSGDGRTVITAAKRGARALGIEYEPQMVELAKRNAEKEGVSSRATFLKQDLFESDFSKATVITMFLLPDINLRLRPTILKLKPGTRIVSNSFPMGDWEPDRRVELTAEKGCETSWCTALLWIVPANVAGTHKIAQGDLKLEQKYQMLTGTLTSDGSSVPVEGKVTGDRVVLKAGGRELRGRYDGKKLTLQPLGTVQK
jgi:hypothetical protein